jgi:two-component system, chemotaxis family, chemotaxis protein CheY
MFKFLKQYGDCDIAVDGMEAIDLFLTAFKEERYYDLVCLDIMMPKLDGLKILRAIRGIEEQGVEGEKVKSKVIMTTALNDKETIQESYDIGCEAYAWKPIDLEKFKEVMKKLELI